MGGEAERTLALERAREAITKRLSVPRICRALKEGLGSPCNPKPRNPITEQARQQQELVERLEELDSRIREGGLRVATLLVPAALITGRTGRADPRLHPWKQTEEWWRLACAHTERVQRELIPALQSRLWPIQPVGG